MLSNEQCSQLVNQYMRNFEKLINILEQEVSKENPDIKKISVAIGKEAELYSLIAALTGIYTGVDTRVGGFKDAIWKSSENEEDEFELPLKGAKKSNGNR